MSRCNDSVQIQFHENRLCILYIHCVPEKGTQDSHWVTLIKLVIKKCRLGTNPCLLSVSHCHHRYQHPVDNAGLFSFMTFNWLTSLAMLAHKKGQLFLEDIWAVSQFESCETNRRRSVLISPIKALIQLKYMLFRPSRGNLFIQYYGVTKVVIPWYQYHRQSRAGYLIQHQSVHVNLLRKKISLN